MIAGTSALPIGEFFQIRYRMLTLLPASLVLARISAPGLSRGGGFALPLRAVGGPAIYFAAVHGAFAEKDQGVKWTRQAFDDCSKYMIYLKPEPWANSLRQEPGFQQIMRLIAKGR